MGFLECHLSTFKFQIIFFIFDVCVLSFQNFSFLGFDSNIVFTCLERFLNLKIIQYNYVITHAYTNANIDVYNLINTGSTERVFWYIEITLKRCDFV